MANSGIYETFLRPLLFSMDAEEAHHLMLSLAPTATALAPVFRSSLVYQAQNLKVHLAGTTLDNPIGLAAGFDKNGHLTALLGHVGLGFAEIGSVTGRASQGNAKPRLFRLPQDEAIVNRMGLNGDGAEAVAARLAQAKLSLPIGLNIAKTNDPSLTGDKAIQDHLLSFNAIKDLPIKYVTINASCPNTHEGCLQQKQELADVLSEIGKLNARGLPLFIKASPDSSDELLADLVELSEVHNLAGFVLGNTSVARDGLATPKDVVESIGKGGLSGRPIRARALDLVARVYGLLGKSTRQIIACGGISSASDAYDFIRAGATCVQLYTALVYHGPFLPARICRDLSSLLEARGESLNELVGAGRAVSRSA